MRFSMITEEGREFVSPMEFIPLLEETGLIIPAGRYILNEAAAMCCEMQKYIPDFRMNVNVSYVQILSLIHISFIGTFFLGLVAWKQNNDLQKIETNTFIANNSCEVFLEIGRAHV